MFVLCGTTLPSVTIYTSEKQTKIYKTGKNNKKVCSSMYWPTIQTMKQTHKTKKIKKNHQHA